MDSQKFREAATATIDEIITYFDTLGSRDVVSAVEPGYLRKLLPAEAPQDGEPWADIQKDIETKIMPGITHWSHPNFHAFFPCATSYPSILGELYSAALSGACFNWICSPAVTELETVVLDWLAKLLGLPACFLSTGPTRGGGVIQGSASEAILTAMVAARDKYLRETLPFPYPLPSSTSSPATDSSDTDTETANAREEAIARKRARMVALGTTLTHSSARKAAQILGVRFRAVRVSARDGYALTAPALAAALAECRAQGLEPFFLAATLGTTDVCSVDDFAGVAEALDADYEAAAAAGSRPGEVWVHVDAAYAGAALVCPEVQARVRIGLIERFHSFDMNMHKWLLVNFDASCFFVRDRDWLVRALGVNQAVYGNKASDGGLVTDYREWQIPLGRRFRSLKIWFVLRSYGVKGLQEYIRRTIALGEQFAASLRAREDLFEIVAGPSFALTVFRLAARSEGETLEERNALTRALYEKVNATGKIWLTSTVLDGRFAIRLMTGVRTTEREHVEAAVKTLVEVAEEVMKG
ncbi:6c8e9a19-778b-44fb-a48f-19a82af5e110 [Thermothielavioides terrestris]|uniref:6c8e9a19-778b-44fb-a48f-19a82af5e110 n=1 Tax=Thermothielavioides terrestris TaxID=2587410 RepID=A0A3S4F3P9_9PEZI|nr:6c8e9a19-778b-44fb-a48f-19a82af5e110 [Thermothielavioides terrestris]